jgi:predicted Zn-dependent peptidase
MPLLETRFGNWAPPAAPKGVKAFTARIPAPRPRIVLIDRPQSPQSVILAGAVLPMKGTDDIVPLTAANEALGGNFLSRLNMDLRETKGWSYGVSGRPSQFEQAVPYIISAPVQADRTGDSVKAILGQIREFTTTKGITSEELTRAVNGNTRGLAGSFETSGAVLQALRSNALFKRPDNYFETLAERYRGLNTSALDVTARAAIRPDQMVFVIVGDAAKVRPQLAGIGLPIEMMTVQ